MTPRITGLMAVMLIMISATVIVGCKASDLTPEQKAGLNVAMVWTTADADGNGSLSHDEVVAAGLRTLNEVAKAYPKWIKWEGSMRTETGRAAFIEAGIQLYRQYSAEPVTVPGE